MKLRILIYCFIFYFTFFKWYLAGDAAAYRPSFNHIPPLIFYDAHVKSVKHTGLVSFGHYLDLSAIELNVPETFEERLRWADITWEGRGQPCNEN